MIGFIFGVFVGTVYTCGVLAYWKATRGFRDTDDWRDNEE